MNRGVRHTKSSPTDGHTTLCSKKPRQLALQGLFQCNVTSSEVNSSPGIMFWKGSIPLRVWGNKLVAACRRRESRVSDIETKLFLDCHHGLCRTFIAWQDEVNGENQHVLIKAHSVCRNGFWFLEKSRSGHCF